MTDSTFHDHSKKIVQNFLSTAVILDDQPFYSLISPATQLNTPPGRSRTMSKEGNTAEIKEERTKQEEFSKDSHLLDVQKVVNSFARENILCTVLNPTESKLRQENEETLPLIQKADLLIFDWQLGDDTALNLIKDTVDIFKKLKQIRLIGVYTGATNIDNIAKQITTQLPDSTHKIDDNIYCWQIDSCQLLLFAKEQANTGDGTIKKVPFEELPGFLIEKYTDTTKGVLSNTVMKSFAVIKENTYSILEKFKELDAPFLTHRICLSNPEEAEDHLATIISEEFQFLLEELKVGEESRLHIIQKYFQEDEDCRNRIKEKYGTKTEPIGDDVFQMLLEQGVESNFSGISKTQKGEIYKTFTSTILDRESEKTTTHPSDLQFSALATLKSKYSKSKPHLSAGIVIQDTNNKNYWLCIQPGCDSVRLKGSTQFPFLSLVSDEEKRKSKVQCVIPGPSGLFQRKKILLKFSDCQILTFTPPEGLKEITPDAGSGDLIFRDDDQNEYIFVCELKPIYAQQIANEFANSISRVATNTPEWLRRISK